MTSRTLHGQGLPEGGLPADSGNRAGKDREETVTLPAGGDHRPTMPLDHRCKEAIMPLQRHLHRLRLNLPPPGGTLDVSQQEGNRPGRQLRAVGLAQPGRRWTRGTNIDRPSRKAVTSQDKPGFRVFSCPSLSLNSALEEESSGASPNDPDRPNHAAAGVYERRHANAALQRYRSSRSIL